MVPRSRPLSSFAFSSPIRALSRVPTERFQVKQRVRHDSSSRPGRGLLAETEAPLATFRSPVHRLNANDNAKLSSRLKTPSVSQAQYTKSAHRIAAPSPPEDPRTIHVAQIEISPAPTPDTTNQRNKRDAYDLLSPPDAEWSTLSTNKKDDRRIHQRGDTTTAKFRLPITSTRHHSQPEAKRRRIAYLPPAPAADISQLQSPNSPINKSATAWKVTRIMPSDIQQKYKYDTDSRGMPMSRKEAADKLQHNYGHPWTRPDRWISQAARNYPSPPRCSSPPAQKLLLRSPDHHDVVELPPTSHYTSKSASSNTPNCPPIHNISTRHSLPSPPRSDSPSALQSDKYDSSDRPDGSGFVHLPFDSEMLEDRYVKMRRKITEVWFVVHYV